MAPLMRQTTSRLVLEEIRKRIISGKLRGGDQIRQEAIAAELGVSRIPVREALNQLQAEGLVTMISHKGAEVTPMEPANVEECIELRYLLEGWLLKKAVQNISDEEIKDIERVVIAMDGNVGIMKWCQLNHQFHELLYRPAQSPEAMKIFHRVLKNFARHDIVKALLDGDGRQRMNEQHRDILKAVKQKDGCQAMERLHIHTSYAMDKLRRSFLRVKDGQEHVNGKKRRKAG